MARKMVNVCAHCGKPIYEGDEVWCGIGGEYCSAECANKAESSEVYYNEEEYYDDIDLFEPENDDYPNDYYEGW